MKNMIIGITGYAGSGKDTLADFLIENNQFKKLEFAKKIKEILSDLYDVPIEYFYDRLLKNKPTERIDAIIHECFAKSPPNQIDNPQ